MIKEATKSVQILGIPFFSGNVKECYEQLNEDGGLLTAPSGPGLANIPHDQVYYESVLNSDIIIPDSGYMVLVWNLLSKEKLKRLSGLEFINFFVEAYPKEKEQRLMLVNPTLSEQQANLTYLNSIGIACTEEDCYIAPFYQAGQVQDEVLLQLIESRRPRWVLINIGGGTQEILGAYLKENLSYLPALICTGAAIAFKTGKQVDIPVWADQLYLGWLFRIASDPQKYYRRYWEAGPLGSLLMKYRANKVLKMVS